VRVLLIGATGFLGRAIRDELHQQGIDTLSLSRRPAPADEPSIAGDATRPNLGLTAKDADQLRTSITHIISCFGSVDWDAGPRAATDLHGRGTRMVIELANQCPQLERLVHISSILALGRARGPITNRELNVGQSFRNWYEYAKYLAERELRSNGHEIPWRAVRFGPILGVHGGIAPDPRFGLPAAVPFLLRGYPAHMRARGRFPCWVTDVASAAHITRLALTDSAESNTWTWFDPSRPTLAEALAALCSAWHVVPRIVDLPLLGTLRHYAARRVGLPAALNAYAEPWVDLDPHILDDLPTPVPLPPQDYLVHTGHAMRTRDPGGFA
jgi:nucleoside-diphosphate-sugar epimerase